jgi:hypothetical protein
VRELDGARSYKDGFTRPQLLDFIRRWSADRLRRGPNSSRSRARSELS